MTALMPVVPATTTYRPCSTARSRPNASCCSLIASLKVALLDGTASSWAPLRTDSRAARSKITSQQVVTPTGTPAACTTPVPSPGQILAERLHNPLVVAVGGTGPGIPDDHRICRHRVVAGVAGRGEHTADQDRRVDGR